MDDLDLELVNLLKQDKKERTGVYHESLEVERRAIVAAFHDHVMNTEAFIEEDITPESIADSVTVEDDDGLEAWSMQEAILNELIQTDLEHYPMLHEGEMKISGVGIYMIDRDDRGCEIGELTGGSTINGSIYKYSIAPLVSLDDANDAVASVPALWVELDNVTISNASDIVVDASDRALVPLIMPTLRFDKVRYTNNEDMMTFQELFPEDRPDKDLGARLNDSVLRLICQGIEEDLNSVSISDDTEHFNKRKTHRRVLDALTQVFDRDEKITLTAHDVISVTDDTTSDIEGGEAYFNGVTIIQIQSTQQWKVVCGFSVMDTETHEFDRYIHVLPETIQSAHYQ